MPSLNNYHISRRDFGFSVITGLSGAPYAKRHWRLSHEEDRSSKRWGHRLIALIEFIPLLGGVAAIIDRLSAKISRKPLKQASSSSDSTSDEIPPPLKVPEKKPGIMLSDEARVFYEKGRFYEAGLGGFMKNSEKAGEFYEKAALLGLPAALFHLGRYYEKGFGGFQKDLTKAKELYQQAADKGDEDSKKRLKRLDS